MLFKIFLFYFLLGKHTQGLDKKFNEFYIYIILFVVVQYNIICFSRA